MKECAGCSTPLGKKNQGSLCRACREKINQPPKVVGREYTAFELGIALLTLPNADRQLPVIVGSQLGGPDRELVIEVCRPENEAPYVWIGDPDA
jgi:hypothetical protein